MARRKRRSFSPEFKAEAVRLVKESGRPLAQVARELDVDKTTLGAWKRELEGATPAAQTVTEREELRRLRRENARLKLEQEILKKAMAFFANDGR